ncbi:MULTISPECIES: helix-turn-helix transcriptional regulator [Rhodococcus]|nr:MULTISPECIES: LuxR C-terminal-related transcriptional regulator [Rhodococcus]MDV7243568.1 LuxR C-terminal-related transcriptional regulator [Rhodococcus oxybenzonivorans]MDV7277544.1 LuxR C-terminal-related transcriptional regulator [Rhodococcus oxybenzonivorans]MDV7335428.1 LuxR C-terminal-related transcriptional regulator [Rhodococcus oxybenzonivorans]MDV7347256.1 LuxR C-terminal-related transcriptional regulator [Rhodococcus oxybenzonivorans]MDV8028685.1 LuxR C-terminal-related transcrip
MSQRWPLIRRQAEFDVITASLKARSECCGVVLTGDPGVGKTTLARFATESLPGEVRWVAGTESARSIPLGVFAHLVGASTSRDPVTLLSTARQALIHDGDTNQDMVIGVDDAHLLDQLSATFLHQLALDRVVNIVATVRSGETVPDAITSLWKDGHLLRLELMPFTREQSIELVESVLDGPLEGLSADMIWEASGGNALFVRHLVEGALEAGTLRRSGGVWQLRGRAAITSELASLLETRIEKIPPDVLQALQLLTFCEPLDLDVLCALAGENAVEEAERRGLVRIAEERHHLDVRYTHPLFAEVIRRRVGRAAGRRLRGKLVQELSNGPVTGAAHRIRLAELALDSDRSVDPALLASAAADAIGLANVPLGERLARAAFEETGDFGAADLLARALLWQGHAAEAEALLLAFSPDSLTQAQLVRWGTSRIANLFWALGDSEKADDVLAVLRERVTQPSLLPVVEGIGSVCAVFENRPQEAVDAACVVLASERPWAVEWAFFGGGLALALMGRGDEVPALAARSAAVAEQIDGLLRFPAGHGEILALTMTGQFDRAQRRAEQYLAFASSGRYLAWGLANILVGTVELVRGRFTAAAQRLEQAIAALDVGDTADAVSWSVPAYIALGQTYAVLGRIHEGQRVISEARARSGRHVAVFGPQLELSAAWLAAAQGETSQAIALARSAAETAAAAGQFGVEAAALHLATRFGDHSTAPRLAALAEQCDGELVRIAAAQASSSASADGPGLAAAADRFRTVGALPDAADAYAQAAIAFHRAGVKRSSVECAATAAALADECDRMLSPALAEAAHPLPLTIREREIASMVAAGLSNRHIADRLFLSVRTVEGHIYHACIKLGVEDRNGLAQLMNLTTRPTKNE